jgi:hypothetical protein
MPNSPDPPAEDPSDIAPSGLDQGLNRPWPEETCAAARSFALGDILEKVPLRYVRHAGPRLWNSASTDPMIGSVIVEGSGYEPRYAIITSQTCDLIDQGDQQDQPWFQVCPVVELAPDARSLPSYLHRLTATELPDGPWAADLRIEVPLEKTLLLGRRPIRAFAHEEDEIDFAARLGRRRDRAALADGINSFLYATFNKRRSNNRSRWRRVRAALYAAGLAIDEGSRLDPRAVAVHFIVEPPELPLDSCAWLEQWWEAAHQAAKEAQRPFRLLKNTYHRRDAMDLAIYDNLIPLEWF